MFNPFVDPWILNPLFGLEKVEMAARCVYFFKDEEFVAKRELIRIVTEYEEAQEAYPDCRMWLKISKNAPWQYYYKGEKFSHFRAAHDEVPVPKALPMMELIGAL